MDPKPADQPTMETPTPTPDPEPAKGDAPDGGKTLLNSETPKADSVFDPAGLKFPEGFDSSDPLLNEFTEIAKSVNMKTEDAQKFVGLYEKSVQGFVQAQQDAWSQTLRGWENEIKSDKDIGGEKLTKEVLPAIAKVVDEFGGPEVRKALDITGAGSHPALVRMFYRLATALGEARNHVQGGNAGQKPTGIGPAALYPDLPPGV